VSLLERRRSWAGQALQRIRGEPVDDEVAEGLVWNKALETGGVAVGDEVQLTIDAELVEEMKAAKN
jgi:hypothetical protein